MIIFKPVYEPQEDSTMLERWVKRHASGRVLDVGTGSGIQAIAAALNPKVKSVLAVDIQKNSIDYCRKNIKNRKIKFLQSDLFENVKGKFDAIIFNPPYLPQEMGVLDIELEGGKKGYETIQKFIELVNKFLSKDGIVLIAFSSLTKKEKVEEFIKNNLLDFTELEKMHIFFEDLYVYLLKKNDILKMLEDKKISEIRYLAKGHRGLLFTGIYKNKKIAAKIKNPQSAAFGRIANEAKWLKVLNKYGIGPRLLQSGEDYFFYEFIKGDFIVNYLKKSGKSRIKKVIRYIFLQMRKLDELKIDKEEMHHPTKHIIVNRYGPFLIDFERAHKSYNPKNVTQFCQFVTGGHLSGILSGKGIKISKNKSIKLAKVYKKQQTTKNFKSILKFFA